MIEPSEKQVQALKKIKEQPVQTMILVTALEDRELIRKTLSSQDYRINICLTRHSLEDNLRKKPADLLILEWEALGGEAILYLRKVQALRPGIAVVLVGENPPVHDVIQALKGGVFDFVTNPYTPEQLEDTAVRALENRKAFIEILRLSESLKEANRKLRIQKRKLQEEKLALKKWGEEMNLLHELSQAVAATFDMEEIVRSAVRRIGDLVSYDIISLALCKPGRQWISATASLGPSRLKEIQTVIRSGGEMESSVTILDDLNPPSGGRLPSIREMTSVMLPMTVGEVEVGALRLWKMKESNGEISEGFDPHQIQILSMAANTLSLALNNAISYSQVQSLATTDSLTGLLNKRCFWSALEKEFKTTVRYQAPLSLIMIDLDHFKEINDAYGHQAGDQVIRELSTLLTKSLREIDLPARYGGDELAIVLPSTPPVQAFFVAKRIKKLVEGHLFQIEGVEDGIHVTVSLGIASCPYPEIQKMEDLINMADKALYAAKRGGRNRVESDAALFRQDNVFLEMPAV